MKNYDHMETVDKNRHAKLRVKQNPDFGHAKTFNIAAVSMSELTACAANYPIVFVQNPDNQQYRPVAMLGLRPGENSYYNENGWDTTYVPMMIQRHPFLIGFDDREEDSNTLTTCLDRNSTLFSEDEGIAMFSEAGEETDYLRSRMNLLSAIFEGEKITEKFTQKVAELDLLMPLELLLQPQDGEPRKVAGMFTIDERKMRALTAEQITELHKLDFLPACYIIMASLFQLHELMRLRNLKSGELCNYRIELLPQGQNQEQPFNVGGA